MVIQEKREQVVEIVDLLSCVKPGPAMHVIRDAVPGQEREILGEVRALLHKDCDIAVPGFPYPKRVAGCSSYTSVVAETTRLWILRATISASFFFVSALVFPFAGSSSSMVPACPARAGEGMIGWYPNSQFFFTEEKSVVKIMFESPMTAPVLRKLVSRSTVEPLHADSMICCAALNFVTSASRKR